MQSRHVQHLHDQVGIKVVLGAWLPRQDDVQQACSGRVIYVPAPTYMYVDQWCTVAETVSRHQHVLWSGREPPPRLPSLCDRTLFSSSFSLPSSPGSFSPCCNHTRKRAPTTHRRSIAKLCVSSSSGRASSTLSAQASTFAAVSSTAPLPIFLAAGSSYSCTFFRSCPGSAPQSSMSVSSWLRSSARAVSLAAAAPNCSLKAPATDCALMGARQDTAYIVPSSSRSLGPLLLDPNANFRTIPRVNAVAGYLILRRAYAPSML